MVTFGGAKVGGVGPSYYSRKAAKKNPWLVHLARVRSKHSNLSVTEQATLASKTYTAKTSSERYRTKHKRVSQEKRISRDIKKFKKQHSMTKKGKMTKKTARAAISAIKAIKALGLPGFGKKKKRRSKK